VMVVQQEPKLLPLSIKDNLVFGCKEEPTMAKIQSACEDANIWSSLSDPQKFPNGLETRMSAVQNVAGGEKQRICIARAILANAPILLLDEATSALDEESQEIVQQALNRLMKGRTTLVVAHRLSTISRSQQIVALAGDKYSKKHGANHRGTVIDSGTHAELILKPDGVYSQLWEKSTAVSTDGVSAPTSLPQMQSTTVSTDGKLDVIRAAVRNLGADENATHHVLELISKMASETGNTSKLKEPKGWFQGDFQALSRKLSCDPSVTAEGQISRAQSGATSLTRILTRGSSYEGMW